MFWTFVATVRGDINRLMGEVLVDHIQEYIEGEANDANRSDACDEVVEVIRAYLFSS